MALKIVEFFGFPPLSPLASGYISGKQCPYTVSPCIKPNHGACSVRQTTSEPIVCCPNRLYAENYRALREVATEVFGQQIELITAAEGRARKGSQSLTGSEVIAFGKGWGGELPLLSVVKTFGTTRGVDQRSVGLVSD